MKKKSESFLDFSFLDNFKMSKIETFEKGSEND